MDIKDLNKSQLIMLAILLSFVISIATGITTVTLMEQAPSSVTVPINRVVRQTVEKIQQVEGKTNTVVVKEEDLVVDAISKNQPSSFVFTKEGFDTSTGITTEISAGRGIAISQSGLVAVDAAFAAENGTFYLKNSSGKFRADLVNVDPAGFSILKIGEPVDGQSKLSLTLPTFGDISAMKAGQKIIIFGSTISSFIFDGGDSIKTGSASRANAGAMVLNLDGEVLGMNLSSDTNSFVSAAAIQEGLAKVQTQ